MCYEQESNNLVISHALEFPYRCSSHQHQGWSSHVHTVLAYLTYLDIQLSNPLDCMQFDIKFNGNLCGLVSECIGLVDYTLFKVPQVAWMNWDWWTVTGRDT